MCGSGGFGGLMPRTLFQYSSLVHTLMQAGFIGISEKKISEVDKL